MNVDHLIEPVKMGDLTIDSKKTEPILIGEGGGFGNTSPLQARSSKGPLGASTESRGWFITLWMSGILSGELSKNSPEVVGASPDEIRTKLRLDEIKSQILGLRELDYAIGQMEQCPKTQQLHCHFILRFKRTVRMFVAFQKAFGKGHHYETQKASDVKSVIGYCTKKESRVDGPWIVGNGISESEVNEIMANYVSKKTAPSVEKLPVPSDTKEPKAKVDSAAEVRKTLEYVKNDIRTKGKDSVFWVDIYSLGFRNPCACHIVSKSLECDED